MHLVHWSRTCDGLLPVGSSCVRKYSERLVDPQLVHRVAEASVVVLLAGAVRLALVDDRFELLDRFGFLALLVVLPAFVFVVLIGI